MIAGEIAEALERAATALDADDAVAASEALAEALRACAAAEAQGLRLDVAALARLRELHGRGEAAAGRVAEKIALALETAGSARRASTAYGR